MDQQMKNIYFDILELSSEEIQRRRWLGQDPVEISSYTEIMCRLFDDNKFEDFLRDPKTVKLLSKQTIDGMVDLKIMSDRYVEKGTDFEILNDPNWKVIIKRLQKYVRDGMPMLNHPQAIKLIDFC